MIFTCITQHTALAWAFSACVDAPLLHQQCCSDGFFVVLTSPLVFKSGTMAPKAKAAGKGGLKRTGRSRTKTIAKGINDKSHAKVGYLLICCLLFTLLLVSLPDI